MIKKLIKKHGAINLTMALTTLLCLVGTLVSIIYTNLNGEVITNTEEISTLKSNYAGVMVWQKDKGDEIDALYNSAIERNLILRADPRTATSTQ